MELEQAFDDFTKVLGKYAQLWDIHMTLTEKSASNRLMLEVSLVIEDDEEEGLTFPSRCHTIFLTYEGSCRFLWKRRDRDNVVVTDQSIFEIIYINDLLEEAF